MEILFYSRTIKKNISPKQLLSLRTPDVRIGLLVMRDITAVRLNDQFCEWNGF